MRSIPCVYSRLDRWHTLSGIWMHIQVSKLTDIVDVWRGKIKISFNLSIRALWYIMPCMYLIHFISTHWLTFQQIYHDLTFMVKKKTALYSEIFFYAFLIHSNFIPSTPKLVKINIYKQVFDGTTIRGSTNGTSRETV